jgi:hypothetical protein
MNNVAYIKILPDDDDTVHFTFTLNYAEFEINRVVYTFDERQDYYLMTTINSFSSSISLGAKTNSYRCRWTE